MVPELRSGERSRWWEVVRVELAACFALKVENETCCNGLGREERFRRRKDECWWCDRPLGLDWLGLKCLGILRLFDKRGR